MRKLPIIKRFGSLMIMIMVKRRPEETTYVKEGVGLFIDMITVNGWCAGGKLGVGVGKKGGK